MKPAESSSARPRAGTLRPVTPSLSIVVVNWNAAPDLRRCLHALAAQDEDGFEVVLVDNGSEDDSLAVATEALPRVRVLQTGSNLGFAAACNAGIEACRGAWILTLNNDTEVAPDFVRCLHAAAESAPPDVGMLQPRVVLRGRERLNSTGVVVYRDGSAEDRDYDASLAARTAADEVLCVTAGAGLYRRAMLDGVRLRSGYFDPGYFMYFEDVDLGWRCRLAGWRALYVPDAVVEHVFQASSRRHGPHFVTTQCMRNRVRTLLKNASVRMILRSLPRTASDLFWLLQHAGGSALADWVRAVQHSARQRADVTRLSNGGRRALERRWVARRMG